MSIRYNALVFKGKSSADFPFDVYIEENDGINKAKRKSKVFTTETMHGGVVRDIEAYETVEKSYLMYIHGVEIREVDELLAWLDGTGKLTPFDNPDRYYEVLSVEAFKSKLDEVGGYEIEVTFICNPFSYPLRDDVRSFTGNSSIVNDSSRVMFPRVTIYGSTSSPTTLTIGNQVVHFRSINNKLVIECKPGEQNVYDANGHLLNSVMKGNFFRIEPGRQGIVFGQDITRVEILCRWGRFI